MNSCGLKVIELDVPSTNHLKGNKLIERVKASPQNIAESIKTNLKNLELEKQPRY